MSSSLGEVISVQIGPSANAACVTRWNSIIESAALQAKSEEKAGENSSKYDEEDYGVLLRNLDVQSRGFNSTSVQPRAVMIDFKSNIGNRRYVERIGEEVAGDRKFATWGGATNVYEAEIDRVGSGWLKDAAFVPHAKSVIELKASDDGFTDSYENGRSVWAANREFANEVDDAVRFYAEECDSLQGFELIVDANTGLVGLSEPVAAHIRDEFGPRKFVASVLLYEDSTRADGTISPWRVAAKRVNTGLALAALSEPSNGIIPCQADGKNGSERYSHFAFMETVSSPYRSRSLSQSGGLRFSEMLAFLADKPGCPVIGTALSFPSPGAISTTSALESAINGAVCSGFLPGLFGTEKGSEDMEKATVVAAVVTTLGLGASPVQDPHGWLRWITGSKMDCRLDMLTKCLRVPSSVEFDGVQNPAVKIWNVQAGSKRGIPCLASLHQTSAVGRLLDAASLFCSKAAKNAKFITAVSSDQSLAVDEITEASELLRTFSERYGYA